jgi:hypothetical protein
MNTAQKRLAWQWAAATVAVVAVLLSAQWILEEWDYLRWPALVLLIIASAFHRKPLPRWSERSQRLNETVQKYPLIRVWLVLYGLFLAVGVFWVLKRHFELIDSPAVFFLLFIGLLAPFLIADQVDKYKALGAQSNPTVDPTRASNARAGHRER